MLIFLKISFCILAVLGAIGPLVAVSRSRDIDKRMKTWLGLLVQSFIILFAVFLIVLWVLALKQNIGHGLHIPTGPKATTHGGFFFSIHDLFVEAVEPNMLAGLLFKAFVEPFYSGAISFELAFWHVFCYLYRAMLTKTKKSKTIGEHRTHATDTGSSEVQIALLSKKIEELAAHLNKNKKDLHSRRGLLTMVADRQRHMNYLQKASAERFNAVMKKLNLKKRA